MTGSPYVSTQGPPYSVLSERVVVASLVRDPKLIPVIARIMPDASPFYSASHERLFKALLTIHRDRNPLDSVALIEALANLDLLEEVGGEKELRRLSEEGQNEDSTLQHARNLVEKARMRKFIEALADLLNEAYRTTEGVEAVLGNARRRLDALALECGEPV